VTSALAERIGGFPGLVPLDLSCPTSHDIGC
jgi:hypothetical protein